MLHGAAQVERCRYEQHRADDSGRRPDDAQPERQGRLAEHAVAAENEQQRDTGDGVRN
jgi:hypothetical protein